MKNIKFIKTTKVMIFPSDDIYLQGLYSESSIQKLQSTFSLTKIPMPPELPMHLPQFFFQNGIFINDKREYIIDQLSIEDRKIIINILSSSDISDLFFVELKKLLLSLDVRDEKGSYEPLITTYETTCVLKLNIKLSQFFNNIKFNEIEKMISKRHNYDANITVIPSSIKFMISYNSIPEKLLNNKITISDKPIVIEIRDKTDPDDQIFFTVSPTDTETHLELLKNIEKMLS